MVKVREDLTGKIFGRLTVLQQVEDKIEPDGTHRAQWLCECSCPEHNQVVVTGKNLKNKNHGTKSCGCLVNDTRFLVHKKYNDVELNLEDEHGLYGIGYCSNTDSKFYFDMDDYDKIKDYCWCEHILQNGYHSLESHEPNSGGILRMHWLVVGKFYDHEDRNPLNNRKYNLRVASRSENGQNSSISKNNTSGIIGVHWHKSQHKWHAYITINYKRIHIGSFDNKYDAIIARLHAELKYFKAGFAPQRHLFSKYGIDITQEGYVQ